MDPWKWGRSWGPSGGPGPGPTTPGPGAHVPMMAGPMAGPMAGSMSGPPILVGERILWLGSGSGVPQGGAVRWMGKLPEMGPSWTLGIELDMALPYGGIDGWWGGRRLFSCEARRGLLVPLSSVVREPQSPGLANWQHPCEQQAAYAPPQQHQQPEYFAAANANQQYPKPAVRRKNVPSFVQSLPLVEEETRQAVYDTREHVQQQRLEEERRESAADTVSDTVSDTALQPSAPPRQRSGARLTRSGDFSAVSWQQAGPSHDLGHGPSPAAQPAPGLGVVRCSSAEALPGPATASASTAPASRPSSGHGLFSFFRWFKKGGRQDGVQGQPATAGSRAGSSDFDDEDDEDDDDDDDDVLQPAYPCRASSYGSIDTVLSTATVSSFRFVQPGAYSLSPASPVQRRDGRDLVAASDTASYRLRIRQRDRRREAEKGISLRRKYRLYGSDTTIHSHRSHSDLLHAEGLAQGLAQDRRQGDPVQDRRHTDVAYDRRQSDLGQERRQSDLGQQRRQSDLGQERRQSDLGQERRQSDLGQERRQSDLGQERRQSDRGQERRQSDIGQERRQSDLVQKRRQSDRVEEGPVDLAEPPEIPPLPSPASRLGSRLGDQGAAVTSDPKAAKPDQKPSQPQSAASSRGVVVQDSAHPLPTARRKASEVTAGPNPFDEPEPAGPAENSPERTPQAKAPLRTPRHTKNPTVGPNPFDEPEPSTSGTSCAASKASKARKPVSTNPFDESDESDESDDDTTVDTAGKPASASTSTAPSTSTLSAASQASQSDLVGCTRSAAPPDRFPDLVVPTLGRKKGREANDYSLPATLEHRESSLTGPLYESATLHIGRYERHQCQHRRSASDTTATGTDTERRLRAHVRGKRRAPTPPCDAAAGTGTASRTSTASKKKRQAPLPPALLEERLEQERLEKERVEKERVEKERLEQERLEKERAERDQLEQDRQRLERERKVEEERLEKLRAEAERLEKEQLERQRLDRERRAEEERLAKERAQRELLERERDERRRLEKEKLERERLEKERNERERLEKALEEKARETERLQREKGEAEQLLRERSERERLEQENIRRLEREIEQAKETLERERLEKEKLDWELRLERLSDRLDRKGKGKGRKGGAGLSAAERERLLGNINKLEAHAARLGSPPGSPRPSAAKDVCRAAAAKETKDKENMAPGSPGAAGASGPVSPVSPRPWYKRSSTHRDSGGFRDIFRSLEKRHKKAAAADEDDWMPESGVPRGSAVAAVAAPQQDGGGGAHATSRFNIFSRLTEEWLGGDKRRSQVSMLANISELDREAAEIVQEQHARQAAVQARRDAEFYARHENGAPEVKHADNGDLENGVAADRQKDAPEDDQERPRKNSAKELISLFNAIGGVPGGSGLQEVPATQDAKRGLFGAARSRSTDDERLRCWGLNGLSPKAARRTTTTPSFYETGPEVAALSEPAFRVEAPLANADDDSDLATTTASTTVSETKSAAKGVYTTSISTAAPSTSTPAKAISTTTATEKDISRNAPGNKAIVTTASTASTSPGPAMKADARLLAGPSTPSKGSGSLWASDTKASATTTTTTITTSVSKAAIKTATTASSTPAISDASARGSTTTSDAKALPSAFAVASAPKAAAPASSAPSTTTPSASATSVFHNGQSMWVCPRCTLENPRWRFTCDACSMWRPAERRPAGLEAREDEADVPPGPPAFLAEDKKAQEKALEKRKAPSTINWEAELKRYFNKDEKAVGAAGQSRTASASSAQDVKAKTGVQVSASAAKPSTTDTKDTQVQPVVSAISPQAPAASPARSEPKADTASAPKGAASTSVAASPRPASTAGAVAAPAQQTAVVKPQPSTTFVGGRLRQDEAVAAARSRLSKSKSEDMAGSVSGHLLGGQAASAAADVEELRKARLAFFRSSAFVDEDNDDLTVALASMSTQTSAVARPAPPQDGGNLRDLLKEMKAGLPDRRNQGASGAGVRVTGEASRSELRVEAKPRSVASTASTAQGVAAARTTRTKVSSSAQTSAQVIRKAEPPPPRPAPAASASAVVQDGVLYTSLRRGSRRLGSGTFKLIGERDFASRASNAPLYMNVLPRPQRDAAPAAPAARAAAVDSSPERRSTTESAEFATPSSSAASSSCGGRSKAPSFGMASPLASPSRSASSASRSDSPASFSSSSERGDALGDALPFVGSPAPSGRGVGSASLSTPMTSSRASSVETPPSSAGHLSRDASMDSVASTSTSASTSASGPSRSLSVVSDCSEVDRLTEQLSAPQGIADFRAALNRAQGVDAAGVPDVNTLAVNRLLRRLEATIASGQHQEAARLAKDLARLKISCSVTRQRKQLDTITVDMYVEDKVSHQGPIPLQVTPSMTVGQLAAKVAQEFQLPENVQRWILGKQLANDRASTLRDHNVVESGCPVFLYLVAPEPDAESSDGDGSSISGHSGDYPNVLGEAPAPEPKRPPPPPADPNRRGGWYFNYEEDRYSFCEDSDEDLSEDDKAPVGPRQAVSTTPTPAPRRVTSPAPPARAVATPVPEPATLRVTSPEPPTRTVTSPTSPEPPNRRVKSPEPAVQRVKSPEPAARGAAPPEPARTATAAAPRTTTSASPPRPETLSPTPAPRRVFGSAAAPQPQHPPVRPQTSGYRSQPLQTVLATATTNTPTNTTTAPKVPASPPPIRAAAAAPAAAKGTATPAAVKATAAPAAAQAAATAASAAGTSTSYEKAEKLPSWRCPRCTLLNSGVRPGCAACTAERPATAAADAAELGLADAEEAERRQRERQYQLLVNLERQDLVPSVEAFECSVCLTEHPGGAGAVLRECLHTFCRACLIQTVQFSDDAEVKCPYRDKEYACDCVLQEREIKALVPAAMYEQHLAKSIKQAERKIENAFHCKTPDCAGWCIFEDNVNEFRCPVCRATNCLTCQAIHSDANCAEYQARLQREAADGSNEDARRTQAMLEEMVARGEG